MEKEIIGNPNDWHIKVYPRRAGDFGHCSISSIKYDEAEAKSLSKDMQENIKRHIDDVGGTKICYDSYICKNCGNFYETKEEAERCGCPLP